MPSSTIIPVGALDASMATDFIILTGWVLDQPVVPYKVERAWAALTNAWPILISRLRKDAKSLQWQYHIPSVVSTQGSFSSSTIAGPIHDHYQFSKKSKTIRCTPKQNPHHLYVPNAPASVEEMLKSDVPLTQLHVTVFDDATLVGLSTPHIFCDAYGIDAIVRALTTILSGGPPPPPLDHADPYAPFAINASVIPDPPYWQTLTILQIVAIVIRTFWEWLSDRHIENRDVFFPEAEVELLKEQAMDDIHRQYGKQSDQWVSSSDALLAFCLKCSFLTTTSTAPFNLFYAANMRKLFPHPSPFLHNSFCAVIAPTLPVSAIQKLSLGDLALHIRHTLDAQRTRPSAENWIRWQIQNAQKIKIFFQPWSGLYNVVTNWRDLNLMDVDFSGALAETDQNGTGQPRKVRCLYLWADGIQPMSPRNRMVIMADEPNGGGVWVSGYLPKRIWDDERGFGSFMSDIP